MNNWDFETFSLIDLKTAGSHRYAIDPSTGVLCFVVKIGGVKHRWWHGMPEDARLVVEATIKAAILRGEKFRAWNAAFERDIYEHILVARWGWPVMQPWQWSCTMVQALTLGLPAGLDKASVVLGGPGKDLAGHRLMLRMCKPTNGKKMKDDPSVLPTWQHDAESVWRLVLYCDKDVDAETWIADRLPELQPDELNLWLWHEHINRRGVRFDVPFAQAAIRTIERREKQLNAEIRKLTGGVVEKITSLPKLREWLQATGYPLFQDSAEDVGIDAADEKIDIELKLDKRAIERYLADPDLPQSVRRVLQIRKEAGKSSVTKLKAIMNRVEPDGCARQLLLFHRASTGRWAGVGLQPQNFVREGVKEFTNARDVVMAADHVQGNIDEIEWGSTHSLISRMLRGTIIARPGNRLIWADYNAIEARGAAWLSGAQWTLTAFAQGKPLYEDMATIIFGRRITEADIPERFVGKTVSLGAQYGLGPPKFQASCERAGRIINLDLSKKAVYSWRDMNRETVEYWYALEDAAKQAISMPGHVARAGLISFYSAGGWLQMQLPGGKILWYCNPRLEADPDRPGKWVIWYDALNGYTKQWGPERTWGGKLFENAVQAICRNLLAHAMRVTETAGYPIVLSVHDELIADVPMIFGSAKEFGMLMASKPEWAGAFPVRVETKEGQFYGK